MDTPGLRQPRTKRDPEKKQKKSKTVSAAPVRCHEWDRGREGCAPSTLPRTNGPYESKWGVRGLQGQKDPRGHATLPCHDRGAAERGQTQKRPVSKKLDAKNEGEGDLRGLQTAIEYAAPRNSGRLKRVLGVEGWKALQSQRYEKRVESIRRREWQWLDEELERPFPLPWLPLDWAESEPEEDRVQTLRTEALQQMDSYL